MTNLMDQLERYGTDFVEAVDALTFDEVAPRRVGSGPVRPILAGPVSGGRPPLVVGLVAAAVVLIVGAAVAFLVRSPSIAPAEPVPTTVPTTTLSSTGTSSPTTTAVGSTETDREPPEAIDGQIEWQIVSGDASSVPQGFRIRPASDGGFVASELGFRYTSSDGVSWDVTELGVPDGAENPRQVEVSGDAWLIDDPTLPEDDTSGMYRLDGTEWMKVDLGLDLPIIEGLHWSATTHASLVGLGDIRLVHTEAVATVRWGDLFGTFEDPDLGQASRPLEPAMWWVPEDRQLKIINPITGDEIATLDVDIRSASPVDIVFTDASTGAEAHRVAGDIPGATEASLLDALANVFGTVLAVDSTWWVSTDGGASFERASVPWSSDGRATVIDSLDDWLYASWYGFDRASFALWRSRDGVEWQSLGSPSFDVPEGHDSIVHVFGQHDELVATVSLIDPDSGEEGRTDYWHSADGDTWVRLGTVPGSPNVSLTSVGWVAVDLDGVSVSQDFENWTRIGDPPLSESEAEESVGFSGSVSATVAGDAVFFWVGDDESGERTLWVGRLTK